MAFVTARREQGSTQHPEGVMGSGEALGMAGEPAAEVGVRQGWSGADQGSRLAWEHGGMGGASGGPRPGRHLSLVLPISGWSPGQQHCQADSGPTPTLLNQSPSPLALTHLLEGSMPALGQLCPEESGGGVTCFCAAVLGPPASYWLGATFLLDFLESLPTWPTWPKRLNKAC